MKKLLFMVMLTMICPQVVNAAWYVVDSENKVIAQCNALPDETDLKSRGEKAIYSEENIPISDATVKGKKIERRTKTAKELSDEQKKKERAAEEEFVNERMKKIAIEQLKTEGHAFKYLGKEE